MRKRPKDFYQKKINNPYFPKKPSKSGSLKRLFFFILFFAAIGFVCYMLFSPKFQIGSISIEGNSFAKTEELNSRVQNFIKQRIFFIIPQSNILLISKKKLEKELYNNYHFENITIFKNLPSTLEIKVKEKEAVLVWIDDNGQYYIDKKGFAFQQVPIAATVQNISEKTSLIRSDATLANIPKVSSGGYGVAELGKDILSENEVGFIIDIDNKLSQETSFEILQYEVLNPTMVDIAAITQYGWQIRFKTDGDINEQIAALNLVLSDKIDSLQNLNYIDLRFGSRVFYK